ncbi:MAG TPA: hypothetical protein DEA22_13065, partial [Blastocatellia bacterium]|nr:hypothetical protein [Blastocatellia bacterium]
KPDEAEAGNPGTPLDVDLREAVDNGQSAGAQFQNAEAETVDAGDYADLPQEENPASFVAFLHTLASNAAIALGAVPHPATGQHELDLETGKYWLDVLGMIRQKTTGNLNSRESQMLEGLLAEFRMQYVAMVRAAEERLKAQAAQKFSGADILGKKG